MLEVRTFVRNSCSYFLAQLFLHETVQSNGSKFSVIYIKALWDCKVMNEVKDEVTTVIHNLNVKIHKDERVDNTFLPTGDGMNLARKK